jgi:hypothetical protein
MQDPAEKPSIARNVLSMPDLIRLTDWARANREQCETLSNKTLATMAGETLSLYLTAANIASALEAVSITKVKPKAPPTLEERVAKLETDLDAYLAAYGARINALEKQVTKMEKELADVTSRLLRALENIRGMTLPNLNPKNSPEFFPPSGNYFIGVDMAKPFSAPKLTGTDIAEVLDVAASATQGHTDTDVKPHSETPSLPYPA